MATDPLQDVSPNQPLQLDHRSVNAWNAAARAHRKTRNVGGAGELPKRGRPPALLVLVRNDTGRNLQARSVVRISGWVTSPVAFPFEVADCPVVKGAIPNASTNLAAILLEAIPDGQFGYGVILGGAVVDVLVNSTSHTCANPISGDTSRLGSSSTGVARIVEWETSGATRRALVVLGDGTGAGSSFTSEELDGNPTTTVKVKWPNTSLTQDGSNVRVNEAGVGVTGLINSTTQSIDGAKTFTETIFANDGAGSSASPSLVLGDGVKFWLDPAGAVPVDLWVDYGGSATDLRYTRFLSKMACEELIAVGNPATLLNTTLLGTHYLQFGDNGAGGTETARIQILELDGDKTIVTFGNIGSYTDLRLGIGGGVSPYGDTVTANGIGYVGGLRVSGSLSVDSTDISDFTESAQDAVGNILIDTARINLTYDDGTPSITADLITDTITAGYLHAGVDSILFGRSTTGAGAGEEVPFATFCQAANNLSDLSSAATARTNLGLGTAATSNTGDFLQTANDLSDLSSAATARTNLGLGALATQSAAIDIGALTDGTGGTADTTLQSVSGTGDDTNINDNFADLTAQVNLIRTNLQAAGIMA